MSKFTIESWQESDVIKGKDTEASIRSAVIKKHYVGVLNGTSVTHYSLCYLPNGCATFTGIEVFSGQYQTCEGHMSLLHEGRFQNGEAKGTLSVIAGSGTEQLKTISGTAHFCAGDQSEHELHTHFSL
ncbi:hypothetical protein PCIT_b0830 [Pseudoalteromonas citrea]|uniref:DUF3224 domain-containing protein n=2 Tax=Pseudoalteromonas citrea TaxID=43655 RepID=A0AAD4AF06_9GAMM|nr:DUF3224 domain-containing protein [Pseudoalteromonas citrea]KAF7764766.1 hypothetical protein PCIT_b0830 [Pseudoalteromonas citrea]